MSPTEEVYAMLDDDFDDRLRLAVLRAAVASRLELSAEGAYWLLDGMGLDPWLYIRGEMVAVCTPHGVAHIKVTE